MRGDSQFIKLVALGLLCGCTESHATRSERGEPEAGALSEDATETASPGRAGQPAAGQAAAGAGGSWLTRLLAARAAGGRVAEVPTFESDKAKTTVSDTQVKFEMDLLVPRGAELHRCVYAQFPSDRGEIAVQRVESHYTPGSHHLLAYRSELTAIPEGKEGLLDCYESGASAQQRGSYYEAQQPEEKRELPAGVAHIFQPGEVLVLEAHYINATEKDITAHVEMITHTTNRADIKQEAGTLFYNNVNIMVPPHSTAHTEMSCTLPQDIQLALLWSHMHARGVKFVAETDDPEAAKVLGTLYEEKEWAEPRPRVYPSDPPVVLHAGTRIRFACDFQNDTDKTFRFGQSAEANEMCILHGMYWPRMPRAAEQCLGGMAARR